MHLLFRPDLEKPIFFPVFLQRALWLEYHVHLAKSTPFFQNFYLIAFLVTFHTASTPCAIPAALHPFLIRITNKIHFTLLNNCVIKIIANKNRFIPLLQACSGGLDFNNERRNSYVIYNHSKHRSGCTDYRIKISFLYQKCAGIQSESRKSGNAKTVKDICSISIRRL